MATVTLHAGTVSHSGTPGSTVGSGALWDDASDSTYVQSDTTEGAGSLYVSYAPLDTLTLPAGATVNSVTVNLRAEMVAGSDTPARMAVAVYQGSFPPFGATYLCVVLDTDTGTGGWRFEATSPTDLAHTYDSADFTASSTSQSALVSALTAGASVYAYSLSVSGHSGLTVSHRFYELSVTVDYTGATPPSTVIPPLRQHPRSDGLGASSARRVYPQSPSVQASNRRAGGYL